ncbi:hypothetical protein H4R21_002809 [Coemansia helicoidea]|uniref:Uncharacterized protein n=1 Tax=Coemansia helicoidea TaxID=1286919 RepID=A0ACC1L6A8_9FUNG|nr:hypothetical protein H4R21_002809 [Coemansia helicoidea]
MTSDIHRGYVPISVRVHGYLFPYALAMYITSATISLAAFVYGVTLAYLQPQIWRNAIIRVLIAAQFFSSVFFVFRIMLADVGLKTESACRVVLYMSVATSLLPVNLCVYCVVYIQLVVVYHVSPELRWPRRVTLAAAAAISILPPSPVLFLSPRHFGRNSMCDFSFIPNSKEYAIDMYGYAAWAYLSGVVGLFSLLSVIVHMVRTRRATRHALQSSAESYGPSGAVERVGHTETFNRALVSIIWLPVTPIVSLWFNSLVITVSYYTGELDTPLRFTTVVLFSLQSILLALPLITNPTMRDALAKQLREQRQARAAARSKTQISPLPPAAPAAS